MVEERLGSGPHLSVAFLCEKVLIERDGVFSIIRVVDRFTIPVFGVVPPGVQIPPPVIQAAMVVGLKAGSVATGQYNVRIRGIKPDGGQFLETNAQMFFPGGEDAGVLAPIPVVISNPEQGLYWFDVYFEEALLTRIPMRVLHQVAVLPPIPSQPTEQ